MPIPRWLSSLLSAGKARPVKQTEAVPQRVKVKKLKQKRGTVHETAKRLVPTLIHPLHRPSNTGNDLTMFGESRSMNPERRMKIGSVLPQTLSQYTEGMFSLGGDLMTMFTYAIQDRRDYMDVADELKKYDIAKRILKILKAEILKPNERGEIIELVSEREDVAKRVKWFQKEMNLDWWLNHTLTDILNLGEFTLALEVEEGEGVLAIRDTIDQMSVIAFYDRGKPSNFLVWKNEQYIMEPPNKYWHLAIGDEKMRVALNDTVQRGYQIDFDKLPPELRNKIPEFVRVGEPIFYSVVEKLRQLQILETLVIAIKLSMVTQRKMVSVQVPATMPVEKVMEICQKFEESLNAQIGLQEDPSLITVNEVMSQAGRYTVIPNYTDEKGKLEALDVRADPQVDDIINAMDDYRRNLLVGVGIPYKVVYGSPTNSSEGDRSDDIRAQAMFSNMIASYQNALREAVITLCLIDLTNAGFDVTAEDIDCIFINASVNVGDLEKLEYDDAKQEIIGRKLDFIMKMEANPIINPMLNREGIYEWLADSFDDLTKGIPLFKPGTVLGDTRLHPETEPTGKRAQFLMAVRDQFRKNREVQAQAEGDSVETNRKDDAEFQAQKLHFLKQVRDMFRDAREEIPESLILEFAPEFSAILERKDGGSDLDSQIISTPQGDNGDQTRLGEV